MLNPNINSETENKDERSGHVVTCRPSIEDPEIIEKQTRSVCLKRPYEACNFCQHSNFTLSFKPKEERFNLVQCPRWKSEASRLKGDQPEMYIETELATCEQKPFPYCPSCPSRTELVQLNIDKTKSGWVSRFERFNKETDDG